jgi:hypothetical protein
MLIGMMKLLFVSASFYGILNCRKKILLPA